jgi:hypothetical protein
MFPSLSPVYGFQSLLFIISFSAQNVDTSDVQGARGEPPLPPTSRILIWPVLAAKDDVIYFSSRKIQKTKYMFLDGNTGQSSTAMWYHNTLSRLPG